MFVTAFAGFRSCYLPVIFNKPFSSTCQKKKKILSRIRLLKPKNVPNIWGNQKTACKIGCSWSFGSKNRYSVSINTNLCRIREVSRERSEVALSPELSICFHHSCVCATSVRVICGIPGAWNSQGLAWGLFFSWSGSEYQMLCLKIRILLSSFLWANHLWILFNYFFSLFFRYVVWWQWGESVHVNVLRTPNAVTFCHIEILSIFYELCSRSR